MKDVQNDHIQPRFINPTMVQSQIGSNWVKVASVEQNSLRLQIPHKSYDVIITGTHSAYRGLGYIPKFALTTLNAEDWEFIQKKYGKHPSFKNGRIFVEKNEFEATIKAQSSEIQELAKLSGTAQCEEKDLISSSMASQFEANGGVTDVAVRNMGSA